MILNREYKSKLYSYAINSLGLRDYTRGWMKGDCPNCGRKDKFGLHIGYYRTNCFVCGYHPTPFNLILDLEGFDNYNEVKKFLNNYIGKTYIEHKIERIERKETVLPDGFKSLIFGKSRISKLARSYIVKRGFDPEELSYKGWGYCTSGKYMGYIIIPFYEKGSLIYFNARLFVGNGSKYNNPNIEDFGIGKSMLLYNVDALSIYEEVYLTEGAINAETMGDNGVATGGKKISTYQESMILKSPIKKLTLLLDPDAIKESIEVAMYMSNYKKVRIIKLPDNLDVNDIGYEKTKEMVDKVDFMDYNTLLKLKNNERTQYTYN
jgi:hypothetical protein